MARERDILTRLEWVLMDALWSAKHSTASELQKTLEPSQGWAYSTVKTMLDRLMGMGYVQARRVGNVYEYTPKMKRPRAVSKMVDAMMEQLFGGAVSPFVQHLLERGDFDEEDVAKIKAILEQYDS